MKGNEIGRRLRLCAALLVAAAAGIYHPRTSVRMLQAAVRVWISGLGRDGIVGQALYEQRLSVCRNCIIFFKPLQTCGSPLTRELRGLGCYCNMEAGAQFKAKTCYLDDIYGDEPHYGWHEVNGNATTTSESGAAAGGNSDTGTAESVAEL